MIMKKRTLAYVAAFVFVLVAMLGGMTRSAFAVTFSKDTEWTGTPTGDGITRLKSISFDGVEGDVKITNLKSSNKKVATVSKGSSYLLISYGRKTGSTTISCKVNGVPLKKVFKVKYTSPVKTFKVNGKNIASKYRKKNILRVNQTLRNKKATITAKSGWVITKVENIKNSKWSTKNYKNGTKSVTVKIKTVMPSDGLRITFLNKKTGAEQEIDYLRDYAGTGYSPVG